jgi:hypothetical protein
LEGLVEGRFELGADETSAFGLKILIHPLRHFTTEILATVLEEFLSVGVFATNHTLKSRRNNETHITRITASTAVRHYRVGVVAVFAKRIFFTQRAHLADFIAKRSLVFEAIHDCVA